LPQRLVKVRSHGIALNVAVDGREGAPWLTLLGGISNDHTLWDLHVEALARDFRLLRLDARGHGQSDSSPAPYALRQLVADLVGVWDALDIPQSAVGGLGLGGIVAVEAALGHPDRVSAVVPVSCRATVTPQYRAIWPPMIEAVRRDGLAAIVEPTLARWFSEDFRRAHPEVVASMRAALLRTSLAGYLGSIAALLELDWADRLGDFRMPVLYVSGEHDRVGAPPALMQSLCDATPGARHVVLPGATHISVVCNPAAFTTAVRGLLQ
jgi:3-oxoadipate enol-lactonase